MSGLVVRSHAAAVDIQKFQQEFGEVDEWFKSHAWKACVGS